MEMRFQEIDRKLYPKKISFLKLIPKKNTIFLFLQNLTRLF